MFTLKKHSPSGTHAIRTNWDYVLLMLTNNPQARIIVHVGFVHIFYDKMWRDSWIESSHFVSLEHPTQA